jgi:hypothetical protein
VAESSLSATDFVREIEDAFVARWDLLRSADNENVSLRSKIESPGWETPWFRPISAKFPRCPVDVLNFDFGEERIETLTPGVFIFGQPGLEQTAEAKSVAHMQHGVTVRAVVRLERHHGRRISEPIEIDLSQLIRSAEE